ncbi:MAG: molybdopterin-dependent oxidoreductase [Nitriliruptorales bacterium]|nr:molybdopterin-dependent oxidoreductase [Nitriliruptorales bacterium]
MRSPPASGTSGRARVPNIPSTTIGRHVATNGSGSSVLTVNGEQVTVTAAETTPLIYVLRNDLGLKGVRTGCVIGECGSCTVIADGHSLRSCQISLGDAAGMDLVTPEGLGTPDAPHPVQEAFLSEQAGQCGYCINGMIMAVAAAVDAGTIAGEEDARKALEELICRCGTHTRIVKAALRAAGVETEDAGAHGSVERLPGAEADAQAGLPEIVDRYPRMEQWLRLTQEGYVEVDSPKVELGQGISGALRQIAATQLGLPMDLVTLAPTTTGRSVDLGHTAGSNSVEHGGIPLAYAAVAFRRALLERGAALLDAPASQVELTAAGVVRPGTDAAVSLAQLATGEPLTGAITAADVPDWTAAGLGAPLPRADLVRKLTGAGVYLHDLELPGMLHARALLPPSYDAQVATEPDLQQIATAVGARRILRDGRIFLVVAEREDVAIRGVNRLRDAVRWSYDGPDEPVDVLSLLRTLDGDDHQTRLDDGIGEAFAAGRTHKATYSKPYEAHAPMSPSASIGMADGDRLRIWTHSQSPYPLRAELAVLFERDEDAVVVVHVEGPGAYGMNGADDAAALAALAAFAVPGEPVRFQHSMDDEFGWDPYGSAMVADLEASLDENGRIVGYRHRSWTDTHYARPDGNGDRLLVQWLGERGPGRPRFGGHEGGWRNTVPLYDVGARDIVTRHVRGPLRTGSLRSLGSYMHVFEIESFMDELAELAGQDPVAFRLAHLDDERGRHVLEVAAQTAGWEPHVGPSGRGQGVAFARYKDVKGYAAQVVDVRVDPESGTFTVTRVVVVCDAGTVINPDGLRNQLEGATIQSLSRCLGESLTVTTRGVKERNLSDYPLIGFSGIPRLEVVLVDRPGYPPLGTGESATPPLAAAVANAIDDALGVRLRNLPLTAASLERRLLELSEAEMARVRL